MACITCTFDLKTVTDMHVSSGS